MRRILVTFFTLYLLWALLGQLNHEISGWRVSIFMGGLFVAFAALRLDRTEGLIAVFAAGLLFDANAPFLGLLNFQGTGPFIPEYSQPPLWFGGHALLFCVAHTFVFHFRSRVPREEPLVGVLAALLANLGIFLALSFVVTGRSPQGVDAWPRLMADLMISQTLLAAIAPWFLSLQEKSLELAGASLHAR